jgi:hypothetical protein
MPYFAFELNGFPALIIFLLICYVFIYLPLKLVVILMSHAKQKADKIRLLNQKTIIAEYEPPNGLIPAEIGFLYDTKLSQAEIFATIISLEQKGLAIINETNNQLVIGGTKPATPNLKQFEKYILNFLSNHKDQVISQKLLEKLRPHIKIEYGKESIAPYYDADIAINEQLRAEGYLVGAVVFDCCYWVI